MKVVLFLLMIMSVLIALFLTSHHECSMELVSTQEPTCTANGYTLYSCTICQKQEKDNIRPALGHFECIKSKGFAPTCTEDGETDEVICQRCGKITQPKETLSALGHTPFVSLQGTAATCTRSGKSDETQCSVCKTVLQEQARIASLGHMDANGDCFCDRCEISYGENLKEIDSVEDLKSINNDLDGVYILTSDISLSYEDWFPLGSESNPFTGYLLGEGYTISDLSFANRNGGLFLCNKGTVDGVNLKNISYSSNDFSGTFGGIAAFNKGTIKNCTLDGNNKIHQNLYYHKETGWPYYEEGTMSHTNIFGGFCGINEGTVENCKIKTSFDGKYENTSHYILNPALLFYMPNGETLTANSTIYYGGICGQNKGTIARCSVTDGDRHHLNLVAQNKKYGLAVANTYSYIANLIGYNSGTVENCRADRSVIVQAYGETKINTYNMSEYGVKCNIVIKEDSTYQGIIAQNEGSVSNTLYIGQ